MLNINIKKSNLPLEEENNFINSKKISIDIGLDAIIQISYNNKNVTDILEKLIIDLILSKLDKYGDIYDSFSLVLEKINKELKALSKDYSLDSLNIFLGMCQGETMHFSILGNYSIYLIKNNKIIDIAEGMQGKTLEFSFISSGAINSGDIVFFSNLNLLDYITKDDIYEITKNQKIDKLEIIEQILSQEASKQQFNLVSISSEQKEIEEARNVAIDIIKNQFLSIKDKLIENQKVNSLLEKIKSKINLKNKYVYIGLLSSGILIAILFLFAIISTILSSNIKTAVPEEYKNKLIEAKLILERTNKDLGNPEVFDANIKKATDIIFEVKQKGVFLNDVNKLLDYITSLKKQKDGIETFNIGSQNEQIAFADKNFGLNTIFEVNKKYYFIGKNSIIGPYIKGENPKTYNYPDGEEVISADVDQEGNIFLLTKTYRLLQFNKQVFKYVNVEGQKTWENALSIKTFNSNLYILGENKNQIYRHKPGVNGFSAKYALIDDVDVKNLKISDFGIDGGFYVLKEDLSLDKFFTAPSYEKRSIIINGIKNTSFGNKTSQNAKMFTGLNLNYIYMLIDNKIWIFEADSKSYKDVKSVKYLGQLEASSGNINTFFVPKDGNILVGNNSGVYSINFEVSDGKVIVR